MIISMCKDTILKVKTRILWHTLILETSTKGLYDQIQIITGNFLIETHSNP